MVIKALNLINFRNQIKNDLSFSSQGNLIFGPNGAGKTSILEAVFLLGFGKSFLKIKKSQMINYDHSHFYISGQVESVRGNNEVSMLYREGTELMLNQKKTKITEVSNYIYSMLFSSADYPRFLESFFHSRKLINRFIFGVEPLYLYNILSYNKCLKQKNLLLKKVINDSELKSWNRLISEYSENITKTRMDFINKLNLIIRDNFNKDLKILYKPSFKLDKGISRDSFYDQIERLSGGEKQHNHSLIGPHLDNFSIILKGRNLKYNSSGEKKLYLLLIFIAMLHYFHEVRGEYPIFLLDDFDTAVDKKGLEFLVDNFPDLQIIASSFNRSDFFKHVIELKKEY